MKNPLQLSFLPTFILTQIGGVAIDAILSDTTSFANRITKHPTEDGSIRTDNIVNMPIEIKMLGKLTDTPQIKFGPGITLPIGGLPANIVNDFANPDSIATAAFGGAALASFNELRRLRDTRSTFTVVSDLGIFQNMAFENLSALRGSGDGFGFTFDAQMSQILTVSSNVVLASNVSDDARIGALQEQNVGNQQPVEF